MVISAPFRSIFAIRVLEVVALAHLARHVGERIVDLGEVGLRDDVERRHFRPPPHAPAVDGIDSRLAGFPDARARCRPVNDQLATRWAPTTSSSRTTAGLLEPYPLGVALLEQLDLLELLARLVELAAGGRELGREIGGRRRQIIAPLHRRLGEGRVGVMVDVGDAGALLLDGDLPVEVRGHMVKFADHRLDIGDLAALLLDFEALQADQCVA